MPSMVYERSGAACTVYNSSLHGGRPVLIVAGASVISESNSSKSAEISAAPVLKPGAASHFDFTKLVKILITSELNLGGFGSRG